MRRWLSVGVAAWLLAVASAFVLSPAAATQPSPDAIVRSFHEALIGNSAGDSAGSPQDRYERLAPAVEKAFDMKLMARIAGGQAWQQADEAARQQLQSAMHRFSTAYYASQFSGGSDLRFDLDGVSDGPGKTKLVNTKLVIPDREAVKMVYVVRQEAETGNWQIVDVLLDNGISQLAQRRSEYHRIASNEGASGLAKALNEQADQLLSRP